MLDPKFAAIKWKGVSRKSTEPSRPVVSGGDGDVDGAFPEEKCTIDDTRYTQPRSTRPMWHSCTDCR